MTVEVQEQILQHIADGLPPNRAAQLMGYTPEALAMRRKRDYRFAERYHQALAICLKKHLEVVLQDPDNSRWFLERRYRKEFGTEQAAPEEEKEKAEGESDDLRAWREAVATVPGFAEIQPDAKTEAPPESPA